MAVTVIRFWHRLFDMCVCVCSVWLSLHFRRDSSYALYIHGLQQQLSVMHPLNCTESEFFFSSEYIGVMLCIIIKKKLKVLFFQLGAVKRDFFRTHSRL